MPATIQVVLQSDVSNVGTSGELVKVRPGFPRNFLESQSVRELIYGETFPQIAA